MQGHKRLMYAMMMLSVPNNAQCNAHQHRQTLRASVFVQVSLAQSCRQWLIRFSEYCMRQQATAVNQPPFPLVFNMTNNALDGVDVSRV